MNEGGDYDPSTIELLRTRSLSAVVQDEIERAVLAGELRAGDRINENLLASKLGISRGPIREACRALVAAGLLQSHVNRGVFVRKLSVDEVVELYDIRASLEGLACRLLAGRMTPGVAAQVNQLVEQMADCARREDRDAYAPLNMAFHRAIFAACGNARLARLYDAIEKEQSLYRRTSQARLGALSAGVAEHRAIVDALEARDAARAEQAMWRHVQGGKARLVDAAARDDATAATPSAGGLGREP
jgi:DNA-binding GntR family transcriptional regulator